MAACRVDLSRGQRCCCSIVVEQPILGGCNVRPAWSKIVVALQDRQVARVVNRGCGSFARGRVVEQQVIFGGCDVSPGRGTVNDKALQETVMACGVDLPGRRLGRRRIVVKQPVLRGGDVRPPPGEVSVALKKPVVAKLIDPACCCFSRFRVVVHQQIQSHGFLRFTALNSTWQPHPKRLTGSGHSVLG